MKEKSAHSFERAPFDIQRKGKSLPATKSDKSSLIVVVRLMVALLSDQFEHQTNGKSTGLILHLNHSLNKFSFWKRELSGRTIDLRPFLLDFWNGMR